MTRALQVGDKVRYTPTSTKRSRWEPLIDKLDQVLTVHAIKKEGGGQEYIQLVELLVASKHHWQYADAFTLCENMQHKPANPKQAYGDKKPPVHLIHSIAALHESAALHSGGRKYGVNNYLIDPVEAMTYIGAMKRHIDQWVSGERVDVKELVHHLGAVRACAGILLTAEACGTLIDNRPCALPQAHPPSCTPERYKAATAAAFEEVQNTVEHLNELYPPKQ